MRSFKTLVGALALLLFLHPVFAFDEGPWPSVGGAAGSGSGDSGYQWYFFSVASEVWSSSGFKNCWPPGQRTLASSSCTVGNSLALVPSAPGTTAQLTDWYCHNGTGGTVPAGALAYVYFKTKDDAVDLVNPLTPEIFLAINPGDLASGTQEGASGLTATFHDAGSNLLLMLPYVYYYGTNITTGNIRCGARVGPS